MNNYFFCIVSISYLSLFLFVNFDERTWLDIIISEINTRDLMFIQLWDVIRLFLPLSDMILGL